MLELFNVQPNGLRRIIFLMALISLALWYTEASIDLSNLFGNQFIDTNGTLIENRYLGWILLATFVFLAMRAGLVFNAETKHAATEIGQIEDYKEESEGYVSEIGAHKSAIQRSIDQVDALRETMLAAEVISLPSIVEIDNFKAITPHLQSLAQYEAQFGVAAELSELTKRMREVYEQLCLKESEMKAECRKYYNMGSSGQDYPPYDFEYTESVSFQQDSFRDIETLSSKISQQWSSFEETIRNLEGGSVFLAKKPLEQTGELGQKLETMRKQIEAVIDSPDIKFPDEVSNLIRASRDGARYLRWDRFISNLVATISLGLGLGASISMSFSQFRCAVH